MLQLVGVGAWQTSNPKGPFPFLLESEAGVLGKNFISGIVLKKVQAQETQEHEEVGSVVELVVVQMVMLIKG